jgi:hypothetical protein
MNVNVGIHHNLSFEDILIKLNDKNILFSTFKETGIVPLSSNTIFINKLMDQNNNKSIYIGKFFFSLIANNILEKNNIIKKFISALTELKCKVYTTL